MRVETEWKSGTISSVIQRTIEARPMTDETGGDVRIPWKNAQKPWYQAEREGFEPSMDGTAHTGFRDRRIQPLCHLSRLRKTR